MNSKVFSGTSASPGMNGSSELTCPTKTKVRVARCALSQQVECDVGIAGEAVARLATLRALGDKLRHDIDAAVDDVAHGVSIVRRHVRLLRERVAEPRAGQEIELIDLDIGWQPPFDLRRCVVEFRIAPE